MSCKEGVHYERNPWSLGRGQTCSLGRRGAQKLFLNGMCCRLIDYLICTSVPRVVRDYSYN